MSTMPNLVEKIALLPSDKFVEIKPAFDRYFESMMDYADAVEAYANKLKELKAAIAERSSARKSAIDAEKAMRCKLDEAGSV